MIAPDPLGRGTGGTVCQTLSLYSMRTLQWGYSASYCLDAPELIPAGGMRLVFGLVPAQTFALREPMKEAA